MTPRGLDVVIIGASFAGLFAAAALQRAGARVVLLERDELRDDASERPGVPQGGQPHVLLHRGLVTIEDLLPGLRDEVIAAGGVPMDSGHLAWLTPDGWLPIEDIYEIVSLSRPLLELLVRRRVLALPGVEIRTGARVRSIRREDQQWLVSCAGDEDDPTPAGEEHHPTGRADVVIDASGRSSRMTQWLEELGVRAPAPIVVEAKLGYATRRYRSRGERPIDVGILVASSPANESGGLALPVENQEWLVGAAGFGAHRPGREPDEFDEYLRSLDDPVLADFTELLEPLGDVRLHRQTANRRHPYDRVRAWPPGLLVVGDALTAFNPVYGQGITVAACQAELLGSRLRPGLDSGGTARLQREIARIADLPWSIATGEDVRYPSCAQKQTALQRLLHCWSHRVNRLAAAGDTDCRVTLGSIYHMMAPGTALFGPRIVVAVLRSLVRGVPPSAARPALLDAALGPASVTRPPGP